MFWFTILRYTTFDVAVPRSVLNVLIPCMSIGSVMSYICIYIYMYTQII